MTAGPATQDGLFPDPLGLRLRLAREQAGLLVEQAIAHLGGFGEEAALLRAIARYVVERDR